MYHSFRCNLNTFSIIDKFKKLTSDTYVLFISYLVEY